MGYIDKHGRPELVAQPHIFKGTASPRVVDKNEENGTSTEDELQ